MKGLCAPIRPQAGGPVVAAPRPVPGAARGDPSQRAHSQIPHHRCARAFAPVRELSTLLGPPNGAPVPPGSHRWQRPAGWGLSPRSLPPIFRQPLRGAQGAGVDLISSFRSHGEAATRGW